MFKALTTISSEVIFTSLKVKELSPLIVIPWCSPILIVEIFSPDFVPEIVRLSAKVPKSSVTL